MMSRILLISITNQNPKQLQAFHSSQNKASYARNIFQNFTMPNGLLSIAAYVGARFPETQIHIMSQNLQIYSRFHGGKNIVQTLEFLAENFVEVIMDGIKQEIDNFQPQVIGLSALLDISISALELTAAQIRKYAPNVLLVAGGGPCHNLYAELLLKRNLSVDAICMGEGEIPFTQLVGAQKNMREYINASPYFMTPEKAEQGAAYETAIVRNLDEIPLFDYATFINRYGPDILSAHSDPLDYEHSTKKQAEIMTGRGCPYRCIFCASQSIHGHTVRNRSIEHVLAEIDFWVDKYQIDTIAIMDDHFLNDVPRAIAICDYAGSKGLDIRFYAGLTISSITQDFVDCCVRNRVQEVGLALESGSQHVLSAIVKKPLLLTKAAEVFHMFADTDIFVKINLVLNLPGETWQHVQQTLDYLQTVEFGWAHIFSAIPISGSALHEIMKRQSSTAYSLDDMNFTTSILRNEDTASRMNGDVQYTMNLSINFVHNPYMRAGKYALAAKRFVSLLQTYPDHAFAWYYLAESKKFLGEPYYDELANYQNIVQRSEFWKKYACFFELPID